MEETAYKIINTRLDEESDAKAYEPLEMLGYIVSGSIITNEGDVIEFDEYYPRTQFDSFAAFVPRKQGRTEDGSAQSVPVYINNAYVKMVVPSRVIYTALKDEAYPAHLLPCNQKAPRHDKKESDMIKKAVHPYPGGITNV